ncbi:MAG: hypothetical protein AB7H80_00580 [Candidatus Kapaibacterium sp.]
MNERRCQDCRLSPPFRAEKSKKKSFPWDAAYDFSHGHTAKLPSGAVQQLVASTVKIVNVQAERTTMSALYRRESTALTAPEGATVMWPGMTIPGK